MKQNWGLPESLFNLIPSHYTLINQSTRGYFGFFVFSPQYIQTNDISWKGAGMQMFLARLDKIALLNGSIMSFPLEKDCPRFSDMNISNPKKKIL